MSTSKGKSNTTSFKESLHTGSLAAMAKLRTRRASQHRGYGWVRDLPDARDFMYAAPLYRFAHGLPSSIDLRSKCPPIYDQGQLGSCTGNGIAGAIEFDQRKLGKKAFTPSRLFIYYNERVMEGPSVRIAAHRYATGSSPSQRLGLRRRQIGRMTFRNLLSSRPPPRIATLSSTSCCLMLV